ncbi:beta-ketoacyl-ACP synthase III [Enterococcus cecorum]|uniref:beta-ketoacyl-ACP synthase III n=1 Tax=Enterococcus cecorum TaxID=44008 RepID=UPI003F237B42
MLQIFQTAHYVPKKVLTNEDLSKMMDTSDEWIYSRTGIKTRHIVETENTSDLCINVARQLLDKAKISPEQIGFILVATMTPDYQSPSVACQVQGAIDAYQAFAFDLTAACAGFVYALHTAKGLLHDLPAGQVGMIIGGETLSKVVNWQDRTTSVLFGDAAAGVLVRSSDELGIIKSRCYADGHYAQSLTSGFIANQSPFSVSQETISDKLTMNGRDIFDFTTRTVANSLDKFLGEAKDSVDYFLLHQANVRILDIMAKKLKVDRAKFLQNMEYYGNSSAASIPLLLSESVEKGIIQMNSHQQLVFSGFGGGLSYGHILTTI